MIMIPRLSPKNYARLVLCFSLALTLPLLCGPTILIHELVAYDCLPFVAGYFFQICTFSAVGIVFMPLLTFLRQNAAAAAMRRTARRMEKQGCPSIASWYQSRSEVAEWHMLASMSLLFGLSVFVGKPAAQAQAPTQEHVEPKSVRQVTPVQLALARKLQAELHLNEHGLIRAIKYIRQGYDEAYVRNLFAPGVRKS